MWHSLRVSPRASDEFVSSSTELLRSTSRMLIFAIGGVFLACFLSTAVWPERIGSNVLLILTLAVPTLLLALHFLHGHFLTAQFLLQAGLIGTITFAVYLFQSPELAFLYALLPMMAVITVGWPVGLLVEAVVVGMAWWLLHGLVDGSPSAFYGVAISLGGALAWLLGWAATHALLTATQWSLQNFELARQRAEEALEQRVEFKQIREDLIASNRELVRLSDRLAVLQEAADEARRAKEEFVANVSHELRTPLNMIIGFSEMLLQSSYVYGTKLPPQVLADIAAIERNSQHLSKLVDDVLDLSQIDAGRMALGKDWGDVQEIIDAAVVAVRALYDAKKLYLRAEVADDLPQVFCDSTRIRQVVINLLSNAGRFTEQGGVVIRAEREEDELLVSVSDTGPGIAPQDHGKLFTPFQQLDSSIRRRHGGSGLGLSISKRLIEMHGGRMWLESEVGQGTTFYFSLALQAPPSTADTPGIRRWFSPYSEYEYRHRDRPSKAPVASIVPRYVVQEEGNMLQRLFSRYANGAEIVAVRSTQEALQQLSRAPAQALIVNAPAGSMSSHDMRQWGNLPYETPALTCWVPGEGEAARRLGVLRYLVKPVRREALLSTLSKLQQPIETVLLVDDEQEALQLFSRMLSSARQGYRVLRARDGESALRLLRTRRPDVMLLDLIMPGMDGFRVLKQKSQDPEIQGVPTIVISSRDPTNEPIVSDMLSITRSGGLSVRDLIFCIQSVSEILSSSGLPADRGLPETPDG